MNDCYHVQTNYLTTLGAILLPFLIGTLVMGGASVVLLLWHLHGVSKTFLMMQNVCATLAVFFRYVILALIFGNFARSPLSFKSDLTEYFSNWKFLNYNKGFILQDVFEMISKIFLYELYVFSILQCLNYKVLVCHPLQYQDYCRKKRVMARVILFTVMAVILSLDKIVSFPLLYGKIKIGQNARLAIAIFNIVKHVLFKIGYAGFLLGTAFHVKKAMAELEKVRNVDNLKNILILICHVPLGTGLLYFVEEITTLVASIMLAIDIDRCDHFYIHLVRSVIPIMTLTIYVICAVIHCGAYLLLFPNLRKKLFSCCPSQTE